LLAHSLAAAQQSEALQVAPDATALLLNQAGLYLHERARFPDAIESHERALKIEKASYGPDHPQVAITINNLDLVLPSLGGLEGAKAH
jgi:hypothetical protein